MAILCSSSQTGRIRLDPNMISSINQTLITLIPKCDDPSEIAQFHPISLCNVTYKTLTKTIANRRKHLLPGIVGHLQTNFVKGRNSVDNYVILQEMVHSFSNIRNASDGMFSIKQAYTFLFFFLSQSSFPPNLVIISNLFGNGLGLSFGNGSVATITTIKNGSSTSVLLQPLVNDIRNQLQGSKQKCGFLSQSWRFSVDCS